MNKKQTRIRHIIEELNENSLSDLKALAQKYHVSEMTVRRDLKYIKDNNLFGKFQYDFMSSCSNYYNYDYEVEKNLNLEIKKKIARYAVNLINPNDTIIFDTGTTVQHIVNLLPVDIPLTVICYNSNNLSAFDKMNNINLVLAGGYFHKTSLSFESDENVHLLQRLRASKMFVSTSGIEKNGMTCSNQYEVVTKKAAINSSLQKILVTDSTKFGIVKSSYFSSLEEMDFIITDSNLSAEWIEYLKELDIPLHLI